MHTEKAQQKTQWWLGSEAESSCYDSLLFDENARVVCVFLNKEKGIL